MKCVLRGGWLLAMCVVLSSCGAPLGPVKAVDVFVVSKTGPLPASGTSQRLFAATSMSDLGHLVDTNGGHPTFGDCGGSARSADSAPPNCWQIKSLPANSLLVALEIESQGSCCVTDLIAGNLSADGSSLVLTESTKQVTLGMTVLDWGLALVAIPRDQLRAGHLTVVLHHTGVPGNSIADQSTTIDLT
jgi:hypothetical protein